MTEPEIIWCATSSDTEQHAHESRGHRVCTPPGQETGALYVSDPRYWRKNWKQPRRRCRKCRKELTSRRIQALSPPPDLLPRVRIPHPHIAILEGGASILGDYGPEVLLVRRLFAWFRQGTRVETLIRRYPKVGPARIFDALAFAFDNLDRITAELIQEREAVKRGEES